MLADFTLSDDETGWGTRETTCRKGYQGKKAHVKDSEDDPVHLTDEGTEKIRWHLEQAVTLLEHFPLVGLYSQACKLLGMENLDGDAWRTAAVLSEAAAVTLRHQFLITLHKQIRNHQKESAADNGRNSALEKKRELEALIAARDSVLFPWGTGRFQQMVNTIPEGWTVCQLSLLQHPNCPDKLLLTRLARDKDPVTVQLHSFSGLVGQSVMSEFQDIMQVNRTASKISCKVKWWSTRLELDMRLEGLLETIERRWLGAWRCLLLGQTSDSTYEGLLAAAAKKLARNLSTLLNTAVSVKMAKTLLELSHSADTEHHLPIILSHFLHIDADAPQMGGLVTALTDARPTVTPTPNQPVVLILDKNLHALPWENLPVLASQQVTRVASLAALHLMLQFNAGDSSVLQRGVDQTSVFYVVDPDNNLKYTLDTFKDMFSRQQGWKGIVGERPNKAQYCDALTQHDLFVYCGHGNGSKYLSGDELQQQRCRAVSVLMGCSSVRLDVKPRLDPDGFVFNYLLARCPSVVGNLWDVTDRDIDRFLKQLLDLWLEGDHDKPPSLPALIPAARLACRMRHLIGAAPVVYGLPVTLTKS
nr:hypothetical protein BaRGS_026588 [Batillaria attramentaria]